jgi:cytochrome P450
VKVTTAHSTYAHRTCASSTCSCLQEEVDRVLGDSETPNMEQYKALQYTVRCINESMRLYPHPPVLLRRALRQDVLPNGLTVPKDQDVMLAIYNIHRYALSVPSLADTLHA